MRTNRLPERLMFPEDSVSWMIWILGSLTALGPLSLDMYLPALPALTEDLGASISNTQLSLTFCLLGLAFGQLLAGPLSDALGRRRPLIIGMLIYSAVSLLCALTDSVYLFLILRFIQGLAGSAGIVIARAVVRDHYSGIEMTKFFALLMLVGGVAPIAAPVIGGQVLHFTAWQGIFVLLGILGIVQILAVIWKLPESLHPTFRQTGGFRQTLSTIGSLFADRVFMGYVCVQGFVFAALFAYISGSSFVFQGIYGLSPQAYSAVFAINSIGLIISRQISASLCARLGERKVLAIGLGIIVVGSLAFLLMILLGASFWWVVGTLFFVISSTGTITPASTSLALQHQGHRAGSASALLGVIQMGLGALATPLVGLGGIQTAVPMAIIIVCSGLCAIISFRFTAEEGRLGASEKHATM